MSKKNTIIEINGQRFDVYTGLALDGSAAPAKSVDGIINPYDASEVLAAATKLAPERESLHQLVAAPTMSDVIRSGVNHAGGRNLQSSHILMRHAVKKPGPTLKRRTNVQSANVKIAKKTPAHRIAIKSAAKSVHPAKSKRAAEVQKSLAVQRFRPVKASRHLTPLSTVQAPEFLIATSPLASQPTPRQSAATSADILQRAMKAAHGHNVAHHISPRRYNRHATIIISAFVFALAVTGIFASQNLNTVKMYTASATAGFDARLPGYQPPGYRLGNVQSNAGVVAVNYLSNSDSRQYTLTQQPTNWDSETLRQEFVAKNAASYETLESNGLTIFVVDETRATWVSGGIWYQLHSSTEVSQRQLTDLAASL